MGWKESYMYIYIYKTNFARYIYIKVSYQQKYVFQLETIKFFHVYI